jgi:uncharacterized protein (DUF433 family)
MPNDTNQSDIVPAAPLPIPVSKEVAPGITRTPGVCGGDPCIIRSRIPVWVLHRHRQLGAAEQEILENFEGLTPQDLQNAWAYVDSHPAEIEQMIWENEDW